MPACLGHTLFSFEHAGRSCSWYYISYVLFLSAIYNDGAWRNIYLFLLIEMQEHSWATMDSQLAGIPNVESEESEWTGHSAWAFIALGGLESAGNIASKATGWWACVRYTEGSLLRARHFSHYTGMNAMPGSVCQEILESA
jgi:hypothetical protein